MPVLAVAAALTMGVSACPLSLDFSTYLGGSKGEEIRDVAADVAGNVFLAGGTTSPDFPVTAGAYQAQHNPGVPESPQVAPQDVFVTRIDPSGRTIVWSTLLGGPNHDRAYAVEVGPDGSLYLCGRAGQGFPVTAGAFQTSFGGHSISPFPAPFYGRQDGFVARISADGSRLLWASYLGTNGFEFCRDLDVDAAGNVYAVTPLQDGATPYPAHWFAAGDGPRGGDDLVVLKIAASGSQVLWAAYLGGSRDENGAASIRLDGAGNVIVLTATNSPDAPTTPGVHDRSFGGVHDFYVAKLRGGDGRLVWATYVGGSQLEMVETHQLAVDGGNNVILASETSSADYPTTPGAADRIFTPAQGDPSDVGITKLAPDGSLAASTFLGGSGAEGAEGIALDPDGNLYIAGRTLSVDFRITPNAVQPQNAGGWDGFVAQLSSDLTTLLYSTYLGGERDDALRTAVLDGEGRLSVAGWTDSANWPVQNAVQPQRGGPSDAVAARFAPVALPLPLP